MAPLESSHGHHLPTRAASARAARGRCFDPKRAATAPECRACSASPDRASCRLSINSQGRIKLRLTAAAVRGARRQSLTRITKSYLLALGTTQIISFFTKHWTKFLTHKTGKYPVTCFVSKPSRITLVELYIINTSYQKLPFGSGDDPDKLFFPLKDNKHPWWGHIQPVLVVRAIEVSQAARKKNVIKHIEFRRHPRAHSWRFLIL